ncbi:hypothetical protein EGK11_25955, partial [Klebsiella pneumoniae]
KNGSVKVTRTDLHRCYSPISFTVIRTWTGGDGCGCLCPRRQGLKQVNGTGQNNGQGPAATT